MRGILIALALCGSQFVSASETTLEALKAAGFSSFSLRQIARPSSPAGRAVPVAYSVAASVRVHHASISNMRADLSLFGNKDYQVGDEWGKKPVTSDSASQEGPIFQRAAKATAHYGGATAFYIGFFNGHHMMATNHHVVEAYGCGKSAKFVLLGKSFPCERIFGDYKEIDLALFSIKVAPGEEASLMGIGRNFSFDADIYPGQELLTIGFGVANNPGDEMMSNQDSDCKVFSGRNDFRKLADPDDFNPGPDKVWSFANGCDISHGDSGSAYIDRRTGDVVGIVWTGRIPKSPQVASSKYLDAMLRTQSPEIWKELSYTVPAARIRDGLEASLVNRLLSPDGAATIRAILGRSEVSVVAR